jgi:hypothetical protein
MPRRRADKVIEHRISLSDGLHKEVKEVIKTNKQLSQIGMVGSGAKASLNVAAVAGVAAVGYLGVKAYAEAKGVLPAVKNSLNEAWDWAFGVKTNADGSIVPTTVNAVDVNGNPITVTNPIYKVPILNRIPGVGGLFDWGMKLGATNNPFEDNPAAAAVVDKLTQFEWEKENGAYDSYVNPNYDEAAVAAERARLEKIRQERWNMENLPIKPSDVDDSFGDDYDKNDDGIVDSIGGFEPSDAQRAYLEGMSEMMSDKYEWGYAYQNLVSPSAWTRQQQNFLNLLNTNPPPGGYTPLPGQLDWRWTYQEYVDWALVKFGII